MLFHDHTLHIYYIHYIYIYYLLYITYIDVYIYIYIYILRNTFIYIYINFMPLFYAWGSTTSRLQSHYEEIFTTKLREIPGTH